MSAPLTDEQARLRLAVAETLLHRSLAALPEDRQPLRRLIQVFFMGGGSPRPYAADRATCPFCDEMRVTE